MESVFSRNAVAVIVIGLAGCGRSPDAVTKVRPLSQPSEDSVAELSEDEAARELRRRGFDVTWTTIDGASHVGTVKYPANRRQHKSQSVVPELSEGDFTLMARFPALIELHLVGYDVSLAPANALAQLNAVRRLAVEDIPALDAGLRKLSELPRVEKLQVIDNRGTADDRQLRGLALFPFLKELSLNEVTSRSVTSQGLAVLKGRHFDSLELPLQLRTDATLLLWLNCTRHGGQLAIDDTWTLTSLGVEDLASFVWSHPDVLDLTLQAEGIGVESLQCFSGLGLREFVLPTALRDDAALASIVAAVDRQSSTGKWNLAGWRISDTAVQLLSRNARVTELNLSDTSITDNCLASIVTMGELRELSCAHTSLTDASVPMLMKCRSLVRLDLTGAAVTRSAANFAAQLPALRSLTLPNGEILSMKDSEQEAGANVEAPEDADHPLVARSEPSASNTLRRRPIDRRMATLAEGDAEEMLRLLGHSLTWGDRDGSQHVVAVTLKSQETDAPWRREEPFEHDLRLLGRLPYLARLQVDGGQLKQVAATTLAALSSLEELLVTDYDGRETDELFVAARQIPKLRRLRVLGVGDRLTARGIRQLRGMSLEELSLPAQVCTVDAFAEWLKAMRESRRVDVESCWLLTDADAVRLADVVRSNIHLLAVHLNAEGLTESCLHAFEALNLVDFSIPARLQTDAALAMVLKATDPTARNGVWSFSRWRISDKSLPDICALPGVTALDLSGTLFTDDGLGRLSGLPALRELNLSHTTVSDVGLAEIANCASLTKIDLSRTAITARGLVNLCRLPRLEQLRVSLSKDGIESLRDFGCPTLRQLRVELVAGNPNDVFAPLDLNWGDLTSLERLEVIGPLTDTTWDQVAALGSLKRLRVEGYGQPLTQHAIERLGDILSLETLHLASLAISDDDIARLSSLPKLRALDCDSPGLSDTGGFFLRRCGRGEIGFVLVWRLAALDVPNNAGRGGFVSRSSQLAPPCSPAPAKKELRACGKDTKNREF